MVENMHKFTVSKEPKKWRKHLVLVNWRLRDEQHLKNSIRRYKITDYLTCLNDIERQLEMCPDKYVYIIKLVYREEFYKLPNIVIQSGKDLAETKKKLSEMNLTVFFEIWYCRNPKRNINTVFGRLLIDNSVLYPSRCPVCIEMVWDSSARSIEKYPNMDCPFVAINRENWNSAVEVTEVISNGHNRNDLIFFAKKIASLLSVYTSRIREFGEYIFSCGCNHLSIEFSYSNGELNFIDWDSDNDVRILGK